MARAFLWRLVFLAVAAVLVAALPVRAEGLKPLRGVALVIGQADYEHLGKLPNPENDARAIEAMLSDLGFETDVASNRDARRLKRDLEGFVEDAEDADVALIYYSGHGIEAGGENWLVPVDADVSSLDDAGEKLVPLSAIVAELKAKVPVTVVLLDACRNDPFPPGSLLKANPGDAGKPIAAGGLGESRGVVALKPDAKPITSTDISLGQVIGFAAEPGKVALDGPAGGNSPYAAAILRHLGALSGEEFAMVMRMVGEEVYLKTGGKQRPWVNESLRRLIYFGSPSPLPTGEEGDILKERRQLLLTIAALPDLERRQVEVAAAEGGVPMDALYGMLNVLGAKAPNQPEQLDAVLRSQTARLKEILAERASLKSADPEITRLSALADQALNEGALASALAIHERAKARVKQTEATLQQAASDLTARFTESAAVYAASAATYEIAYNYGKAATDYGEAFRLIEKWDDRLAWKYKNAQAFALNRLSDIVGGQETVERAIATARQAVTLASRTDRAEDEAASQDTLAYALRTLAVRGGDRASMREALAAMQVAVDAIPRAKDPVRWARHQSDLAQVLRDLAIMEDDPATMEKAVEASRAAVDELKTGPDRAEWAMAMSNLGNVLIAASTRLPDVSGLHAEAIAAYRGALEQFEPGTYQFGLVAANLADALNDRGRQGDLAASREAIAVLRGLLARPIRDGQPRLWGRAQVNLAEALAVVGTYGDGTAELEQATTAYRAALEIYTEERDPLNFVLAQHNLGAALVTLGQREQGTQRFVEAVAALRIAATGYDKRKSAQGGIAVAFLLGNALLSWGEREGGTERLVAAATAYRDALSRLAVNPWPPYVSSVQMGLADTLVALSHRTGDPYRLEEAIAALRIALASYEATGSEVQVSIARDKLGRALLELGERRRDADLIREGRAAISAAWEFHKAEGRTEFADYFEPLLARADRVLQDVEKR